MRKKIFSILFALILLFAIKNTCSAANAGISCDTNATVGDKINISVTGSGVQWNLELKVNGETIAKNSEVDNIDGNRNISFSGTYTPTSEGTLKVTLAGTVTEATDGSTIREFQGKTITIKAKETGDNDNTTNSTTPSTTTKSSEARLKDLGITPNDFKGFKRDKYTYDVEVPNDVSKVNVYAKTVDSKAKISGTGNVTLKEGKNSVSVVVTAEDGTKKTYTINITRSTETEEAEEESDSEARLKNLGINPKEYDFSGFKKDTLEYSVEVPNDVSEIEIYAEALSSKAKIKGTGKIELKEGENTANIEVIAEDGTKKIYSIDITRAKAEQPVEEENNEDEVEKIFGLSKLEIKNLTLNPKFNVKTYEYKVELTEDLNSLDILAQSNDSKSNVEIIGNENLKQGETTITILVTNPETEEVATYQIIVNKNVTQTSEVVGSVDWLKPSTWGVKEKIIVGIAIALVIIIVVAIIIKIRLSRKEDEDLDLPGAEELDRALIEHQELAEDTEVKKERSLVEELYENRKQEKFSNESSEIEMAQEYFENYSKRKGKHF